MRVSCPGCQATLKMNDGLGGKRVRCPRCSEVFQVPLEEEDDYEEEEVVARPAPPVSRKRSRVVDEDDDYDDDDYEEEEPVRRRKKPTRRRPRPMSASRVVLLWAAVIGGAMLLVVALGVLGFWLLRSRAQANKTKGPGGQPALNVVAWTPDPNLLPQLAPETGLKSLGGLVFRPPAGYTHTRMPMAGEEVEAWRGPTRADGTTPILMALVYKVPRPGEFHNMETELGQIFDGIKQSQSAVFPEMSRSHSELGDLAGVRFVRSRVTASSPTKGPAHGFIYLGFFGAYRVGWFSEELDAHEDNLRLLESSVLTLRVSR